jgi:hypothetical protein
LFVDDDYALQGLITVEDTLKRIEHRGTADRQRLVGDGKGVRDNGSLVESALDD